MLVRASWFAYVVARVRRRFPNTNHWCRAKNRSRCRPSREETRPRCCHHGPRCRCWVRPRHRQRNWGLRVWWWDQKAPEVSLDGVYSVAWMHGRIRTARAAVVQQWRRVRHQNAWVTWRRRRKTSPRSRHRERGLRRGWKFQILKSSIYL